MMYGIVLVLIAVIFAAQLMLCFSGKKNFVKLVPVMLIGIGEVVCGVVYLVSSYLDSIGEGIYGAPFAAVIYAIVLLIMLAGDGMAWLIWAIVKSAQNKRK